MMAEGRKTGEERLGKEKENGRKGRRREDGGGKDKGREKKGVKRTDGKEKEKR